MHLLPWNLLSPASRAASFARSGRGRSVRRMRLISESSLSDSTPHRSGCIDTGCPDYSILLYAHRAYVHRTSRLFCLPVISQHFSFHSMPLDGGIAGIFEYPCGGHIFAHFLHFPFARRFKHSGVICIGNFPSGDARGFNFSISTSLFRSCSFAAIKSASASLQHAKNSVLVVASARMTTTPAIGYFNRAAL